MPDAPPPYPLSWPPGFPRAAKREKGAFRTTLAQALENVRRSLTLFGQDSGKPVSGITISSNVTLGINNPEDPGVAVWFIWEEMQLCIPVDRYASTAANLQAVHHVLEARRTELRHGTLALVRATFSGFKALPAPDWRSVLNVRGNVTIEAAEAAYKLMARSVHPDKGGSQEEMVRVNAAIEAARKELRNA